MEVLCLLVVGLDKIIEKFSSYLLIISVLGMLLLTVFAIVARKFSISFIWIDPLVRHLVFLSAFLGGILAVGKGQHISIDVLGKFFEAHKNGTSLTAVRIAQAILSALLLSWLIYSSLPYVQMVFKFEHAPFLGIQKGYLVSIIPLGLGLMGLRFLFRFTILLSEFFRE